jgi:DNA-binding LytR/AlgR family response regulator
MNCIIIEDQLPAQRILKIYIRDTDQLNLLATFSNAIQAKQWLNSHTVDVIFLDIHLPKLSGIEFLKSIQNPPQVIFTTAFGDYALESYDLNVVDYLLKPFSYQRFLKAISKLVLKNDSGNATKKSSGQKDLFLKSGHDYVRLNIGEIQYINSDSDYTDIYVEDKKHISSESLKYWEDKLGPLNFIRVHKSFIVNLKKIERLTANKIYMASGDQIPIGRTYKKNLTKKYIQ